MRKDFNTMKQISQSTNMRADERVKMVKNLLDDIKSQGSKLFDSWGI